MAWIARGSVVAGLVGMLMATGCGSDEKPKSSAFGGSGGDAGSAGNAGSSSGGQAGSGTAGSSGSSSGGSSGGGAGGSTAGSGGSGAGGSAGSSGSAGTGGGDAATEFTPQDDCELCEQTDCATSLGACDDDTECAAMLECVAMGCTLDQAGAGCIKTCMESACSSSASVQLFLNTLSCRYCNTACQTACGGMCSNVSTDASSYTCTN